MQEDQSDQPVQEQEATVTPIHEKVSLKKVDHLHRVMHAQLAVIRIFPDEYAGFKVLLNWTESLFNKKVKMMMPQKADKLTLMKISHDNYATIAHLLSTRCQDKFMNMETIVEAINYAKEMALAIKTEVEKIEPPKEEEKKPFEMDLSHVKADEQERPSEN